MGFVLINFVLHCSFFPVSFFTSLTRVSKWFLHLPTPNCHPLSLNKLLFSIYRVERKKERKNLLVQRAECRVCHLLDPQSPHVVERTPLKCHHLSFLSFLFFSDYFLKVIKSTRGTVEKWISNDSQLIRGKMTNSAL